LQLVVGDDDDDDDDFIWKYKTSVGINHIKTPGGIPFA
jgi:hypothetical protein